MNARIGRVAPALLAAVVGAAVAACGASTTGSLANAERSTAESAPTPPTAIVEVAERSTATPGTVYAVTYDQTSARWSASPGIGRAKVWRAKDARCASDEIPNGYWIVARAADGSPELVAASHTALPAGHAERLALKVCGDGGPEAVHAPQAVIELLADNAGVVYVDD